MNKRIEKISGYFKTKKFRNDKRVVVFLVCVLIATVLWFLNALSKDYTTTIFYPVKYVSAPKNQFLANELPSKLELKVQAHGFTLLRHKLNLTFSPIVLNLTNITRNVELEPNGYRVSTNNLIRRVADQVSNEISITDILPEFIVIKLDSLKTISVPVLTNIEVNFKPQFDLKEPISTYPEKIQITGPATILDTIFSLQTIGKIYDNIDSNLEKTVELIYPKGITVKPEKVSIKILVEKFTEKEIKVPVQVKNKPEEVKIKLFPSDIKLTVLVGLSEFERITMSDFNVFVDYNKISSSTENLEVIIESKPAFVQIKRFSPEVVEYLIEIN